MLPRITPEDTLKPVYQAFLSSLAATPFTGEIRTDYSTRLCIATDNSIYQVIPQAVIFPRSTQDIAAILTLSQEEKFHDICFSPRGGGTGTNGQSLSAGIIIDCSKYMRDILELNLEEQWIRVQPGVVLDQLNTYLKPQGLHFAPEISPSNRATLGGMINTDACGNGSRILGRTSDHIVDLTYVTTNGTILQTSDTAPYQAITDLLIANRELILNKFTNAPRTLNGYNLKKALHNNKLNLNYLLCGSEGTLAIISECKLKLSLIPKYKKLVVVKYRNFNDALRAHEFTPAIKPLVIETIDEKLIDLARSDSIYFQIKHFIENDTEKTGAINLVEFVGDDETDIDKQAHALCDNIKSSHHAIGFYVTNKPAEIKLLWDLRKKSVGLISKKITGTRRPIPFIEDTAVPPEHLADYISEFKNLLDEYGLIYGMYGHVDAGCVHVRPALDMKLAADEKLIRELSDKVVNLIKKYNGILWGEHGQGFRSEYGIQFFGETLHHVIRQIKTIFDPLNKLNPGKIAVPLENTGTLVRLEGPLRGQFDKQISASDQVSFTTTIACNGNGACFNYATAETMCPSFKVTQDRVHSPKGRASLMREWLRQLSLKKFDLQNSKPSSFFSKLSRRTKTDFSHEVYAAMAGCLGCKACANQCPLNVDVPEFKTKFLFQYHQRYLRPFRDYLIASTEYIAQIQSHFPKLSNWIVSQKLIKKLLFSALQLTDIPLLSTFSAKNELQKRGVLNIQNAKKPNSLVLLQDALTSFYQPHVLISTVDLLIKLGFSVYVPPFFANGKPLHAKGFLPAFSRLAKKNIQFLKQWNIPIIGIDPSITLTYRDEYKKAFPNETIQVWLLQEWLSKNLPALKKVPASSYFLISHCTEKTACVESETQWQQIFSAFGLSLTSLIAGCCGMAGYYGHEAEHAENSKKLFSMDWKKYITEHGKTILATGYSCRNQTTRFMDMDLLHPTQALLSHIS